MDIYQFALAAALFASAIALASCFSNDDNDEQATGS